MFDFLFRKSGGKPEQSVLDLITINATKAMLSDLAIEKAIGMIAKAIAKSEFIVQRENGRIEDDVYWMLNIKTNNNETATEFWINAIEKLLKEGECLIIHMNGRMFRASTFQKDNEVLVDKRYTNVSIEVDDDTYLLNRPFTASEVMHLRNTNRKIKEYLKKNLDLYNQIATGLLAGKKIASTPKFNLDVEGGMPLVRTKNEDGTDKILTIDQYKEKIRELLASENIEVITNREGMKVSQLQISSTITMEEISKMAKEIFTECAYAFDIPKAVFLGEITEKADSTNEFITYAVNWLVELLNDSMNAALVGKESYLSGGERIWIDLSRYKHVDIIESAGNLDKLRSNGFSLDEIRYLVGWEKLNTDFSRARALTKNYTTEGGDAGAS